MKYLKFKAYSLRTKFIYLHLFSVFIPLFILSQVMLKDSQNRIIEQTTTLTRESAKQTMNNIEDLLQQYADLLTRISFDETLCNYLNPKREYSSNIDSIDAYQNYLKPLTYGLSLQYATTSLKIYYMNETLLPGLGIYEKVDENVENLEVYQRAIEAGSDIVWGREEDNIYLSRTIRYYGNLYGVVSIQFNESRLYSLINESKAEEKRIIISDENGMVISTNDRSVGDKQSKEDIDHKKYSYIYNTITDKNMPQWTIITQIPLRSLIHEAEVVRNKGIFVSSITLITSLSLFIISLNWVMKRIRNLVNVMGFVKEGSFVKVEDDGMEDEIGYLTNSFNLMIEGLEKSIQENYEVNLSLRDAIIKKREAELYALQSQINPHFLFNTLESIRMKLLSSENNIEASNMVYNLSKILRKALNWQGDMILLREEIDFVCCYVEIQKSRFKDKIEAYYDIPEKLLDIHIPKLLIQPIVENAIKHGIENKKGKGTIRISIREIEERIQITVSDNGNGIEAHKLEDIRSSLTDENINHKEGRSIGIRNIHERIIIHYGRNYGIQIDSSIGQGTIVIIEIPLLTDKED